MMAELAKQLSRIWGLILGREHDDSADASAEWISFADLVWAHDQRQRQVFAGILDGDWEHEYRRRLGLFTKQYGTILDSYWCRHEASGVVITQKKLSRRPSNLWRRDEILRIHSATDWRTSNAPAVFGTLHRWESLAIRASEVLRESSERIALQRIFAASSRLLAFVDRRPEAARLEAEDLEPILARQEHELRQVLRYYARAGENTARIVYFRGMLWGTLMLGVVAGALVLLIMALGSFHPHEASTQNLFVSLGMGALGAIVSVMTRMATADGFNLDFEVGRKSVRQLGGLRPWIGGVLAAIVYLALQSDLVQIGQSSKGIHFYATVAFLAGFSERRAKILLDGIALGPSEQKPPASRAASVTPAPSA
jgi:hypothetical protein